MYRFKKLTYFDIKFIDIDHNGDMAIAGESIAGCVVMHVCGSKKMSKLYLEFQGKAETLLGQSNGGSRQFFHELIDVSDQLSTVCLRNGSITGGMYKIPFQFLVPPDAPNSFEGPYGSIRYSVTATLAWSWKPSRHCSKNFTVIGRNTLSTNQLAMRPVLKENDEQLYSFCGIKQGPVSYSLKLPKSGYVPGDVIPISLELNNKTRSILKTFSAKLYQKIVYKANSASEITDTEVAKLVRRIEIQPNKSETLREFLSIPNNLPPQLQVSRFVDQNLIDIRYNLEIKFDSLVFISVPIYLAPNISTIVDIDDDDLVAQLASDDDIDIMADQSATGSDQLANGNLNDSPPKYETLAPPTYAEAVRQRMQKRLSLINN